MQPLFFGESDKPLFGVYHEPLVLNGYSQRSVLICPPVANEYLTTHWSLMSLARRLAKAGYHVFRFDYFGTGDSSGQMSECTMAQWIADVQTAARELADLSGNRHVSLVGLRFGACLAAAAAANLEVDMLLCWEPILKGAEHIHELETAHSVAKKKYHLVSDESIGYPYSEQLLRSIRAMNLIDLLAGAGYPVAIVSSAESQQLLELKIQLEAKGLLRGYYFEEFGDVWLSKLANQERTRVPGKLLLELQNALESRTQ